MKDDEDAVDGGAATAAVDSKLFEMLKDLRKQFAKEKKLPPFVIFLEIIIGRHGNAISHLIGRA